MENIFRYLEQQVEYHIDRITNMNKVEGWDEYIVRVGWYSTATPFRRVNALKLNLLSG